mmetsp:Transcript_80897/g.196270  ORF Transcript_80897/g.196270 Transcript_80897/m.196270 type:complete len:267 (+) Transcript_80897:473-1273(+)
MASARPPAVVSTLSAKPSPRLDMVALSAALADWKSSEALGEAPFLSTGLPSTLMSIVLPSWRASTAFSLTATSRTVTPSCVTTNWSNHWFLASELWKVLPLRRIDAPSGDLHSSSGDILPAASQKCVPEPWLLNIGSPCTETTGGGAGEGGGEAEGGGGLNLRMVKCALTPSVHSSSSSTTCSSHGMGWYMGLAAVVSSTSSSATLHVCVATSKAPESSFSSAVGSPTMSQPGSVSALLTAQPPVKATCDQPECCPDRMVSTPLPL